MMKKEKTTLLRIVSRLFDYLITYLIFTFCLSYSREVLDEWVYVTGLIASPLLWSPLEALLLSTLGTTPGKLLLGMRIRERNGSKLSFKRAFARSLSFLSRGWDARNEIRIERSKQLAVRYFLFCFLSVTMVTPLLLDDYSDASEDHSLISRLTQEPIAMKWKEFKAPYGDFQVEFPTRPTEGETTLGKPGSALPVTEFCTDKKQEVTYSVSYTTLPHKWVKWGAGPVLKGALKMMAKHFKQTIVSKVSQKHGKLPALHYLLTSGSHEKHGKLILVGYRLYRVEITYPKEKREEIQTARHTFLESFRSTNSIAK